MYVKGPPPLALGVLLLLHSAAVAQMGTPQYSAPSNSDMIDKRTSNGQRDMRSVALSEMSKDATISVSIGTILDFTSGNSNIGSSVVSSSNAAVVSVISSTQARANAIGTAVITVHLFQSSGAGQIGPSTAHKVIINVQ
jgi:hypothetical protein